MARQKAAKPLTPKRLENAALFYVERFAPSEARLKAMLSRRIRRAGVSEEEAKPLIAAGQALIERLKALGLLDDRRYAEAKVHAMSRRGLSQRRIKGRLAVDGIDPDLSAASLKAAQGDEAPDIADLRAALRYAERRRLGPFRPAKERQATKARDLAALGRQGFSYETARRVVDAADPESLSDEIESR